MISIRRRRISVVLLAALMASCAVQAAAQSSIEGRILFAGPPPRPAPLKVTQDQQFCGNQEPNEEIVVTNGALANVVVSIENPPKSAAKVKDIVLTNDHCHYVPHVSAAAVGSSLTIRSNDDILHNTHVYMPDGTTFFNIALPFKAAQAKRPLQKPGIMNVKCDVGHVWMSATIHVFAHPFFGVSDESGNFKIEGLPAGQYTLKAWHEKLGTQTQRIQVNAGSNRAEFTFKSPPS